MSNFYLNEQQVAGYSHTTKQWKKSKQLLVATCCRKGSRGHSRAWGPKSVQVFRFKNMIKTSDICSKYRLNTNSNWSFVSSIRNICTPLDNSAISYYDILLLVSLSNILPQALQFDSSSCTLLIIWLSCLHTAVRDLVFFFVHIVLTCRKTLIALRLLHYHQNTAPTTQRIQHHNMTDGVCACITDRVLSTKTYSIQPLDVHMVHAPSVVSVARVCMSPIASVQFLYVNTNICICWMERWQGKWAVTIQWTVLHRSSHLPLVQFKHWLQLHLCAY